MGEDFIWCRGWLGNHREKNDYGKIGKCFRENDLFLNSHDGGGGGGD